MHPIAPQKPYQTQDGRSDPYYWLREKDHPDVLAYLHAENVYTEHVLAPTVPHQETLFQAMVARIQETDISAPAPMEQYEYYFRTVKDQQYRIFCRKKRQPNAPEIILIDENQLATQYAYFHVGAYALSPDENWMAYTLDTSGDESYQLVLWDLANNRLLTTTQRGIDGHVVFASNNRALWYCKLDNAHRPYQLWCHDFMTDAPDTLLYEESDERFWLSAYRTQDDHYLMLNVHSKITSEVHYVLADTPTTSLTCLIPRRDHIEYDVEHHQDYFIVRSNDNAKNFCVLKIPVATPDIQHASIMIATDPLVTIDSVTVFANDLITEERRDGLPCLHVYPWSALEDHYLIPLPEASYTVEIGENHFFKTDILRFEYMSLSTPKTIFDFNLRTRERTLVKQTPVLGHYRADDYITQRLFATAQDGTQIPISVIHHKNITFPAPVYLTGYGAYGIDSDPWFSHARLSLLQENIIFAIAHIRGGGEYGEIWHDQGKLQYKENSFTDFIACAEKLIADEYTTPEKLVINGGSAGGLLMGAVINLRPDLFKACIAHVPFVDVLNTMLDPTLPLTVIEYDEWGNPHDTSAYQTIARYSPYDNITPQAYPALFITAGLNDPRVPYWEAAKWAAKLRALKTDKNLLLLKTDMDSGHAGVSGRYNALREVAMEYAFIFYALEIGPSL